MHEIDGFDEWWAAYPYRTTPGGRRVKIGKAEARIEYAKALKRDDITEAEMLAGAISYGMCQDPRFIKDAHRWLKKKGYEDGYDLETGSDETDRRQDGIAAAVARSMEPGQHKPGDQGSSPDGARAGPGGALRLVTDGGGQAVG